MYKMMTHASHQLINFRVHSSSFAELNRTTCLEAISIRYLEDSSGYYYFIGSERRENSKMVCQEHDSRLIKTLLQKWHLHPLLFCPHFPFLAHITITSLYGSPFHQVGREGRERERDRERWSSNHSSSSFWWYCCLYQFDAFLRILIFFTLFNKWVIEDVPIFACLFFCLFYWLGIV